MKLDKRDVMKALIAEVERSLDVMITSAKVAHAAATHEEMKPENDKDTRGLEAGYLARGQSQRAAEIEKTLKALKAMPLAAMDVVAAGALVVTEDTDSEARATVFIAPGGGGVKLKVSGIDVQVVTPTSPLGDALDGKRAGDFVEWSAGGKKRELEVVSVA